MRSSITGTPDIARITIAAVTSFALDPRLFKF
jgi:hypothetical protein